jgi:hypothetical protein
MSVTDNNASVGRKRQRLPFDNDTIKDPIPLRSGQPAKIHAARFRTLRVTDGSTSPETSIKRLTTRMIWIQCDASVSVREYLHYDRVEAIRNQPHLLAIHVKSHFLRNQRFPGLVL